MKFKILLEVKMIKIFYNSNRIRPFRILMVIFLFIIGIEIYGIINTPTYEKELKEARERYENLLVWQLRDR